MRKKMLKKQLKELISGKKDKDEVTAFYYLNPTTGKCELLGQVPDGREFIIKVAKY